MRILLMAGLIKKDSTNEWIFVKVKYLAEKKKGEADLCNYAKKQV